MLNPKMKPRACGIVFCYNEEQILEECLQHYLIQGIDLVIVDNNSTDSSLAIVRASQKDQEKYPGRIHAVLQITTEGYEWERMLKFACDYMHERLSSYEWILLIDADAFYHSPVKGMSLLEFMESVKKRGCNIIDGQLIEFYPTEKDDVSISLPIQRLNYCKVYNPCPQHKIFLYHPSIKFYEGGHICMRENARVSMVKFLYLHYPWVSYEHGVKKIFLERKPRYVNRRLAPYVSPQYLGLLPIRKDLIKQSRSLWYFRKEKILKSQLLFSFLMKFNRLYELVVSTQERLKKGWVGKISQRVWRIEKYAMRFWIVFNYKRSLGFRFFLASIRSVIKRRKAAAQNQNLPPQTSFLTTEAGEWIQQRPFAAGLPRTYHFLMTDYCNAHCTFCNQDFDPRSRKSITFEKFKAMLSHIPPTRGTTFMLSGGGDPLLCKDLFSIIRHVNTDFPWVDIDIRTNGLLIGKYAEQLAGSCIHNLEISVHGATRESNHTVLHGKNDQQDVFKGIVLLNQYLKSSGNQMKKVFCPVVSLVNVEEIPLLVKKAAELKVDEIKVAFAKYYPWETYQITDAARAKVEDSLFYHKEKYNEVILKSKRLARSLGLSFAHEPSFFKKFKTEPCFQPWHEMIINWEGDVYPCTGGEVWFNEKVKSGQYHFGNLIK